MHKLFCISCMFAISLLVRDLLGTHFSTNWKVSASGFLFNLSNVISFTPCFFAKSTLNASNSLALNSCVLLSLPFLLSVFFLPSFVKASLSFLFSSDTMSFLAFPFFASLYSIVSISDLSLLLDSSLSLILDFLSSFWIICPVFTCDPVFPWSQFLQKSEITTSWMHNLVSLLIESTANFDLLSPFLTVSSLFSGFFFTYFSSAVLLFRTLSSFDSYVPFSTPTFGWLSLQLWQKSSIKTLWMHILTPVSRLWNTSLPAKVRSSSLSCNFLFFLSFLVTFSCFTGSFFASDISGMLGVSIFNDLWFSSQLLHISCICILWMHSFLLFSTFTLGFGWDTDSSVFLWSITLSSIFFVSFILSSAIFVSAIFSFFFLCGNTVLSSTSGDFDIITGTFSLCCFGSISICFFVISESFVSETLVLVLLSDLWLSIHWWQESARGTAWMQNLDSLVFFLESSNLLCLLSNSVPSCEIWFLIFNSSFSFDLLIIFFFLFVSNVSLTLVIFSVVIFDPLLSIDCWFSVQVLQKLSIAISWMHILEDPSLLHLFWLLSSALLFISNFFSFFVFSLSIFSPSSLCTDLSLLLSFTFFSDFSCLMGLLSIVTFDALLSKDFWFSMHLLQESFRFMSCIQEQIEMSDICFFWLFFIFDSSLSLPSNFFPCFTSTIVSLFLIFFLFLSSSASLGAIEVHLSNAFCSSLHLWQKSDIEISCTQSPLPWTFVFTWVIAVFLIFFSLSFWVSDFASILLVFSCELFTFDFVNFTIVEVSFNLVFLVISDSLDDFVFSFFSFCFIELCLAGAWFILFFSSTTPSVFFFISIFSYGSSSSIVLNVFIAGATSIISGACPLSNAATSPSCITKPVSPLLTSNLRSQRGNCCVALMWSSLLPNDKQPLTGLAGSLASTRMVMEFSSKALKTNGSLTSFVLIELTASSSPVNGSCRSWMTFPLNLTAIDEVWETSMSPEMARGRNPCRLLITFSALSSVIQYTRIVFTHALGKFSR